MDTNLPEDAPKERIQREGRPALHLGNISLGYFLTGQPPLKHRAFRKSQEPQRGPAVRILSAPPTSQCEPPVLFALKGGQWTKFHHPRSEVKKT
jgi:hypothetical protein